MTLRRGALAAGIHVTAFAVPLTLLDRAALGEPRVLSFLALAAAFAAAEAMSQRGDDRPGPIASREAVAAGVCTLAVIALALATRSTRGGWVGAAVGAALMVGGITLRVAAMRALGGEFVSEVRAAAPTALVTNGPYARRRHPSEVGTLAIASGACLVLGSHLALVGWAIALLPLTLWRIRREEERLRALFGADWVRYSAVVPPL